jgi:hypothetical protein
MSNRGRSSRNPNFYVVVLDFHEAKLGSRGRELCAGEI